MINHARTLLLNKDGNARPGSDFYLEEFVDQSFRALSYSTALNTIREMLVGNASDDGYLNFRLRQYMTLLDSTEFRSYATALDPRITYSGQSPAVVRTSNTVTPLSGLAIAEIVFAGEVMPIPAQVYYKWRVTALTPYVVRTLFESTGQTVDTIVTISEGITSAIAMAGQPAFNIRIQEAISLPVGAEWRVTSFVEPADDVASVVQDIKASNLQYLGYIFPAVEPYKTFKELWVKQELLAYQLSGLLLAWVYRAEEERLHA